MISVLASVVESNASSLNSSLSGNLSSNLSALSNGLSGNLSILSNLSVLSPYPLQPVVPGGSNFSGGNGSGAGAGAGGAVGAGASQDGGPVFPAYIRTTSMVLCIIILGIGVVGNIMVPIVILKTKDMRNSTNIFLTNLSIADLMVLLVCTPTVLVEVNSKPETWVLGEEMCKAVPFVELTVAHASVLTILAISFERYYAICEPLKAGYVCTKTRALIICLLAWALAALFTSPILTIAEYHTEMWYDSTFVAVCLTQADTFWRAAFFITSISAFFFLPLFILIVLYSIIARHLMSNPGIVAPAANTAAVRYRRQVVAMLATVVLSFFVCLLPFRAFTLLIILTPPEVVMGLGAEKYYNVLFFCRIMFHLNSAVNPILYNLMSTKFREGFRNICCCKMHRFKKRRRGSRVLARKSTFTTTTLTNTSSSQKSKSSSSEHGYLLKKSVVKMISFDDTCSASLVLEDSLTTKITKFTATRIPLNKLQESYV
nr:PREDICTED: growth hormone secretagogue receptor type 1-like isoform X1 [Bemisia tabaci]XP_018915578.1 PREDICTED: growth hormone secretagogue receptor type 1-like isoform X1 [Bemisia tabaci]XP_018915579.1 PREDICTED: growth hormone secretagogue receptor type 1-like isoform X1 [Bemisia tabaci]